MTWAAFTLTAWGLCLASAVLSTPAIADQPDGYGPSDPFDSGIFPDDGPQTSVRHQAQIWRTAYGYRLIAAEQDSHLRVTLVDGRLRFRDTNVASWKSLPKMCTNQRVNPGVAATCRVPAQNSHLNPTLIEIRPRLGDDWVSAHGLPATFEVAILGDTGDDTLFGGRGDDYVGGAMGSDFTRGGAGNDWMRGGKCDDTIYGGPGGDWIVGMAGDDTIDGGRGINRIFP